MHTVMVIGGGIVLLAICLFCGHWLGDSSGLATGAKLFIPLWFVAVAVNMWVGVARAGYSVADEAPILLLNFAVPAAVAAWIWWKYAAG